MEFQGHYFPEQLMGPRSTLLVKYKLKQLVIYSYIYIDIFAINVDIS